MQYVYILRSKKQKRQTYIGTTDNLERRLEEHNAGKQPHTKRYAPWAMETYIGFTNERKAFEFERY